MIIKICKNATSAKTPLFYNQYKVEKGLAELLCVSDIVFQNKDRDAFSNILHSFNEYEREEKSRTVKTSFHVSINPNPEECNNIDDNTYISIAHDYMESLGYKDQPYAVYKHCDIDRTHIHIVSNRIDSEGKKINDSYEKQRSWRIAQELVNKYNLLPIKSDKKKSIREKIEDAREFNKNLKFSDVDFLNTRTDFKIEKIYTILNYVDLHNCTSFTQYRTLLNQFNVDVQIINNNSGSYRGMKFFIIKNDNPSVLSFGINASDIQKGLSLKSLESDFKINEYQLNKSNKVENKYRNINTSLSWVLNKYDKITLDDLKNEMSLQGYDIITHKNDTKVIYGVSIYDTVEKKILKGSQVGLSSKKLASLVSDITALKPSHKKLIPIINAEYNKLKKERGYFFESTFIKELEESKDVLAALVSKRLPSDNPYLQSSVDQLFDEWIYNKKESLSIVEQKEEKYAEKNLTNILSFAKQHVNRLSVSTFMNNYGFNSQKQENNKTFITYQPRKNERMISFSVSNTDAFTGSLSYTSLEGEYISKAEKEIVKNIHSLENLSFKYVEDRLPLLKLVNEKTQEQIKQRMAESVLEKIIQENICGDKLLKRLFDNGFLLLEKNDKIELRHYSCVNSTIIPPALSEHLKKSKIKDHLKYQHLAHVANNSVFNLKVILNKYNVTENLKLLDYAITSLEYVDNDAYRKVKRYVYKNENIDMSKINQFFNEGINRSLAKTKSFIHKRSDYLKRKR